MTSLERTAAIYTTFHPSDDFRNRINDVVNDCTVIIIVDNTPGGHPFKDVEISGVVLLQDGVNKGLGAAINLGIIEALKWHCNAVVLFDQDSSPRAGFVPKLFSALYLAGSSSIVGPVLLDDKLSTQINNQDAASTDIHFKAVTCVATSGMCFYINTLNYNERFTEDYFLDFVDFDWCWRMRHQGWHVFQVTTLHMPHRLGLSQHNFFGITYHIPSPYRHYFQFRDTLNLIMINYVPIYSRLRLTAVLLPKILIYPFLLDRGLERFTWMTRGIIDAVLGVRGIGYAARKLQGKASNKG
jgi:rhamnosyltransferase